MLHTPVVSRSAVFEPAASSGARSVRSLGTRGQHVGRPKALDQSKADLARRMHASGEPAKTIAVTLGVSSATVYRVLADD